MKEVKYTYHHTASDRGYIPVGKEIKEPYKGKYGRGYIIKRNNPRSNMFYLKDYYISYASVADAEIGDVIVTYCVYNPYTNWDDDVIERLDFIQ